MGLWSQLLRAVKPADFAVWLQATTRSIEQWRPPTNPRSSEPQTRAEYIALSVVSWLHAHVPEGEARDFVREHWAAIVTLASRDSVHAALAELGIGGRSFTRLFNAERARKDRADRDAATATANGLALIEWLCERAYEDTDYELAHALGTCDITVQAGQRRSMFVGWLRMRVERGDYERARDLFADYRAHGGKLTETHFGELLVALGRRLGIERARTKHARVYTGLKLRRPSRG